MPKVMDMFGNALLTAEVEKLHGRPAAAVTAPGYHSRVAMLDTDGHLLRHVYLAMRRGSLVDPPEPRHVLASNLTAAMRAAYVLGSPLIDLVASSARATLPDREYRTCDLNLAAMLRAAPNWRSVSGSMHSAHPALGPATYVSSHKQRKVEPGVQVTMWHIHTGLYIAEVDIDLRDDALGHGAEVLLNAITGGKTCPYATAQALALKRGIHSLPAGSLRVGGEAKNE